MKPQRIQLKRAKGWKMPPNTVKVDRTTGWGNPFKVGVDGTAVECVGHFSRMVLGLRTADCSAECLEAQRAYVQQFKSLGELTGKNLACWCKPGDPCHGEILLELANP